MFLFRSATKTDALAISQVHVSSWRTTYGGIVPDAFLNELNAEERTPRWQQIVESGACVIVVESGGKVVGYINGGPIREPLPGYDAELYAIYLLAEFQGRGLGRVLLIELGQQLSAMGLNSMIAWVVTANESRQFYEKTGALRVSQKEVKIGGASLPAIAYGWFQLKSIAALERRLFE